MPCLSIFVNPSLAERFLIRLSLRDGAVPEKIVALVEKVDTAVPFETTSYQRLSIRNKEKTFVNVVDITTSLRNVIGDTEDKGQIQKLLLEYVRPFMALI